MAQVKLTRELKSKVYQAAKACVEGGNPLFEVGLRSKTDFEQTANMRLVGEDADLYDMVRLADVKEVEADATGLVELDLYVTTGYGDGRGLERNVTVFVTGLGVIAAFDSTELATRAEVLKEWEEETGEEPEEDKEDKEDKEDEQTTEPVKTGGSLEPNKQEDAEPVRWLIDRWDPERRVWRVGYFRTNGEWLDVRLFSSTPPIPWDPSGRTPYEHVREYLQAVNAAIPHDTVPEECGLAIRRALFPRDTPRCPVCGGCFPTPVDDWRTGRHDCSYCHGSGFDTQPRP